MTYAEKLRDGRWQKKRLEILERDGWKCSCCPATNNLQVHHLVYARRDPWDYPNDVYQTLCGDCHALRQELTDKIVDSFRLSLRNIPTMRLETVAQRLFKEAMEEMA